MKRIARVVTLVIAIGVLPFSYCARASANTDTCASTGASRWLDDYKKPVGLTYGAKVTLNSNYLWRGLYSGGPNIQGDVSVGYGGAYVDMWWNIGTTDWAFSQFQPELDLSFGFNRWGVNVYLLYIHNFNSGFFDFNNYADHGNRLEINARYTVSSKLPLSIAWGTRVSAADGYINDAGELVRAWSSYFELSYTHHFPYDISLYGALGMTPWRSRYTAYSKEFGVVNIDLRLSKDWSLSEHCGLTLQGRFCINPTMLAADKSSAQWLPKTPGNQTINANISVGIYLK